MKKNQAGFHTIAVVLIVVVLGVVGFAGWRVYHKSPKAAQDTAATSAPAAKKETTTAKKAGAAVDKVYTNDDYKFSFAYPSDWDFTEDLRELGRGAKEGSVTVISPAGTKVHFDPNLGGKGGDCADENGEYTAKSCSTLEVVLAEPLAGSIPAKPVYFYQMGLTDPGSTTTQYYVTIMNSDYIPRTPQAKIGAFIYPYDEIQQTGVGNITVYVEGKEDSKNTTRDFFKTDQVKEATTVLKSFKFL
jgi:hypothetical protein